MTTTVLILGLSGLWLGTDKPKDVKPAHLDWALKLVDHLPQKDTSYRHKDSSVQWKGIDGATISESHTDCSGFLNALLKRAYGLSESSFQEWLGTERPFAKTYYAAIVAQNRFQQIKHVKDVEPGDILAIQYPPDDPENTDRNTGHVLLVVTRPQLRKPSDPQVDGTEQWEVTVIDQSRSGHGKTDTRHNTEGKDAPGLGQGVFRIYTRKDGTIAGHTWSTLKNSEYRDQKGRNLVIGRLQLAPKP